MRSIKFRVWDRHNKVMITWEELANNPNWKLSDLEDEYWCWMQYTGLKDDAGKEIYEGDIVQFSPVYDDELSLHCVEYCDEKYEYPAFDLHPAIDCEENGLQRVLCTGETIVVGNIYENPELLEGDT